MNKCENKLKIIFCIVILLVMINIAFASAPLRPTNYENRTVEKTVYYGIVRNSIIIEKTEAVIQSKDVIFDEDQKFNVGISITNNYDVDIPFNIKDISVHDHFILKPNLESRNVEDGVDKSKVNFCELSYPKEQLIIKANSEKIINVSITCIDASCIKKYPYEDACWLTLLPKISYVVDEKEKETEMRDYSIESFKLKTVKPSAPLNNLGQECKTSDECTIGFCLQCPSDTNAVIQTDDNYMYVQNINNEHWVKKAGGLGYCAMNPILTRRCEGIWNNNPYNVSFPYEAKDTTAFKELTKDKLDKWKKLVLNNISESYFDNHIVVETIELQTDNNQVNDLLAMGINYKLKFDWVDGPSSREVIYFKKKVAGEWVDLSDEEIMQEFERNRNFLHTYKPSFSAEPISYIKPTEKEIQSIISKEEALKKLKECHADMDIQDINVDSSNNELLLTAYGHVDTDTAACSDDNGKYTIVSGSVNLIDGKLKCESRESPCVVYASEQGRTGEKTGFFQKIINWFKQIFR